MVTSLFWAAISGSRVSMAVSNVWAAIMSSGRKASILLNRSPMISIPFDNPFSMASMGSIFPLMTSWAVSLAISLSALTMEKDSRSKISSFVMISSCESAR